MAPNIKDQKTYNNNNNNKSFMCPKMYIICIIQKFKKKTENKRTGYLRRNSLLFKTELL